MSQITDPEGREMKALNRIVKLRGMKVLEVGCGDGRLTRRIARTAASVVGVDPDAPSIARARETLVDREAERITFLEADVVTLDLPPAGFDVAVFSRSL